jgi:hypothetical protein
LAPDVEPDANGWVALGQWVLGCLTVYLSLFGIGEVLLGTTWWGLALIAASLICGYAIVHSLRENRLKPDA